MVTVKATSGVAQWPRYGFNETGCDINLLLTTCSFWLTPLYKILPHSRTIRDMNFIFTTKQVDEQASSRGVLRGGGGGGGGGNRLAK